RGEGLAPQAIQPGRDRQPSAYGQRLSRAAAGRRRAGALHLPSRFLAVSYQFSRSESCVTREGLPEFRTANSPSDPTVVGLLGLFSTLKKSTLNRRVSLSLSFTNLKAEASRNH